MIKRTTLHTSMNSANEFVRPTLSQTNVLNGTRTLGCTVKRDRTDCLFANMDHKISKSIITMQPISPNDRLPERLTRVHQC
jgi:hypothetical protein